MPAETWGSANRDVINASRDMGKHPQRRGDAQAGMLGSTSTEANRSTAGFITIRLEAKVYVSVSRQCLITE